MPTPARRRMAGPGYRRILAALSVTLAVSGLGYDSGATAQRGAESDVMSRDALRAAIDAGVQNEIQPYYLQPVVKPGPIPGAVFTPHVRVARFARNAYLKGRHVTPEAIPSYVAEPVLHVAIDWSPGDVGRPVKNLSEVFIAAIERPPSAAPVEQSMYFHPKRLTHALRTESADEVSRRLGELPFSHAVKVGAFPAHFADRAVLEFVAYRTYWTSAGGNSRDMIVGFVNGPLK